MEIKNTLTKPYTEKQRLDFIVLNNHNLSYEIRETETELQAWGPTEEEAQEQEKQQRNREIDNKIKHLEEMSIHEVLNNNTENIKLYKDIIDGLNNARL